MSSAVIAIPVVALSGCSGDGIPKAAFVMGALIQEDSWSPTIRPTLEFLEPSTSLTVGPRKKVTCRLRMKPATGQTLPSWLRVTLRDKARDAGGIALEPETRDGAWYVLSGEVRAPARPGTYVLMADAVYQVSSGTRSDGADASDHTRLEHVTFDGPRIVVQP